MSWVAVAIGGAAVIGAGAAVYSANASRSAANTAADAYRTGYEESKGQNSPWRDAGMKALGTYESMVQAGPGEFTKSPYYDFVKQEGVNALERGAASRGKQLSGQQGKALTQYGQEFAKTSYDNWLSNWYKSLTPYQNLAQMGQAAASGTASAALQTGQQVGQTQAAGQLGQAQAYVTGANNVTNLLGNYGMMQQFGGNTQNQNALYNNYMASKGGGNYAGWNPNFSPQYRAFGA